MNNELEELWSNIDGKFKQIRESPQLNDPEISNSINFNGLSRNVRSAKKFYRSSMISIDESVEKFTQPKNSNPSQSEPKQPTPSVGFNVPPCDMQTFSGDFKSWASFKDLSKAIYGNNTHLSGVGKLFYLKNKTSGKAKEIVDNAPLTNNGFLSAWTQLVNQYENKWMQINAQIKTLLNLPMVNTMCSVSIKS